MKRYSAMLACPRFDRCNAPVCPLDPDWKLRTHGNGDQVCFLACEAGKPGAVERFQARAMGELLPHVSAPLPDICARWASIKYTVERAKGTGSRMDRLAPGQIKQVASA